MAYKLDGLLNGEEVWLFEKPRLFNGLMTRDPNDINTFERESHKRILRVVKEWPI